MSDKLFAGCCLGSPQQHAEWEPCPLEAPEVMDTEANQFAAYLLMPPALLDAYVAKNPIFLDDDNWIAKCARKFKVPIGLVVYRIMIEQRLPA